jgi:hypothetical protein
MLPQTCHKPKRAKKENGGLPRFIEGYDFVARMFIFASLWQSLVTNQLIYLMERVMGIEPT